MQMLDVAFVFTAAHQWLAVPWQCYCHRSNGNGLGKLRSVPLGLDWQHPTSTALLLGTFCARMKQ